MTSPEEAALFMQTVQEILRYVKVTKGNLEEGNMRCDANINLNVWEDGKLYHTPISEIKNSKLKTQNCFWQQFKTQNSKFKTHEYRAPCRPACSRCNFPVCW